MNAEHPPQPGASWAPSTPGESLQRLVGELERWGELFLRMARENKALAAEQVLGGLVDWMGNGLIEGWLHLPIPIFEELSDLAEEMLAAFRGYLGGLGENPAVGAKNGCVQQEDAIRAILVRARALVDAIPPSGTDR
jgi:hypothetical protein